MKVVDEGRMLLNGQGRDHGSSELNKIHIKAEVELLVRVLHNIGNTTMKKLSKVTQTKVKNSSNTGVCISRFLILFIMMSVMMSVCGASSTSFLHADNDEQRNHLPRMTTHELKLNNNDSTDQEFDQSSNIHSSSTPVDHHGHEERNLQLTSNPTLKPTTFMLTRNDDCTPT